MAEKKSRKAFEGNFMSEMQRMGRGEGGGGDKVCSKCHTLNHFASVLPPGSCHNRNNQQTRECYTLAGVRKTTIHRLSVIDEETAEIKPQLAA